MSIINPCLEIIVMKTLLRFISVVGMYVGTASIWLQIAGTPPSTVLGVSLMMGGFCAAIYDAARSG